MIISSDLWTVTYLTREGVLSSSLQGASGIAAGSPFLSSFSGNFQPYHIIEKSSVANATYIPHIKHFPVP